MLESYEALASRPFATAEALGSGGPIARLMRLCDLVSPPLEDGASAPAVEAAMRSWAQVDPAAQAVMRRVDARRLAQLSALFSAAGLQPAQAADGALRFYAAVIGSEAMQLSCQIEMRRPLRRVAEGILADAGICLGREAPVDGAAPSASSRVG
ncbi:hypothetical protein Q9295_15225 [Xinfangfangia sp. CPCC 101601]|uniref:Uncharacterized protein n=1 Tax=Pseudogemmobacter lacusdianii TaxID=3069608 RepID=A0ABU0W168_9RHOB|nr:hypothetical protein [Xinfangfangia sp. CPCC 101601]MDQ2067727.1 hypothetical protein [Xinfangfangia sp. CPCC 101601]